jgi:hypothetical protein
MHIYENNSKYPVHLLKSALFERRAFPVYQSRFYPHPPLKQKEDESRDQNEDCAGLHDPETE